MDTEGGSSSGSQPPDFDLIDDLEDGDHLILAQNGRAGFWYLFNDGSEGGMQQPPPSEDFVPASDERADSSWVARTSGSGFVEWGAGMGLFLNWQGSVQRLPYDASGYTGLTFWVRSGSPFRLVIAQTSLARPGAGGTCIPEEGEACEDFYQMYFSETFEDWTELSIDFDQLEQSGWGRVAPLALDELTSIDFSFVADGSEFELEIDDIALYR